MKKKTYIILNRIIAWTLCAFLAAYIIVANTLPFGATVTYSLTNESKSINIGPLSRIEMATSSKGVRITQQKDNIIYFTTPFNHPFEEAQVDITFQNPDSKQTVELGYKDRYMWHYNTQPIDTLIAHHPEWQGVGDGPVLYQKKSDYASLDELLADPEQKTIGTFDYSLSTKETSFTEYVPGTTTTIIDTPLRGKHTIYVYVKDEPFYMKIVKQDLNWYEDPDVMLVKIYREDDVVFNVIFDDDGTSDASHTLGAEEVAEIRNPGPGLPETGVYKIVIDASNDAVIKRIETNLHKIVFAGPLYVMNNEETYPGIVTETGTTTLYTNSSKITAETHHDLSVQELRINNRAISITKKNESETITTNTATSTLVIPKSDLVVNGIGYFAFEKDQLFLPNRYQILPINSPEEMEMVNYIIDPYPPSKTDNDGYLESQRSFSVETAVPDNKKLNWIISAPGLKDNNGTIDIKDINITYTRKGWLKLWENTIQYHNEIE